MPEWIETTCDICGSEGEEGPIPESCLRFNLPHISAMYACVCLRCLDACHGAFEEAAEERMIEWDAVNGDFIILHSK